MEPQTKGQRDASTGLWTIYLRKEAHLNKIIYNNNFKTALKSAELLPPHQYQHLNTDPMSESRATQNYNWPSYITNLNSVLPYKNSSKPSTLATFKPGITSPTI